MWLLGSWKVYQLTLETCDTATSKLHTLAMTPERGLDALLDNIRLL